MKNKKYIYKSILEEYGIEGGDPNALGNVFQKYGNQGWEVVSYQIQRQRQYLPGFGDRLRVNALLKKEEDYEEED